MRGYYFPLLSQNPEPSTRRTVPTTVFSCFVLKDSLLCDKFRRVPMTQDELNALRLLLREELQAELTPFRAEIEKRFDEIASHIDGLYQRDEKREQEYLSIREQIKRLERRSA